MTLKITSVREFVSGNVLLLIFMPTNIITHRCLHNRSKDSQFTCYVCAVPAILNEAVPATTQSVDAEIQSTLKSAYKYTGE